MTLNLRSRKNRNRLRKAGFSDKEIEKLYVHLERLNIVPVVWGEAATKLAGNSTMVSCLYPTPGSVQAAKEARA